MSEQVTPRLMAAAKEFNIGKDTLIDFLISKGFDKEALKPTAKLNAEMYQALQIEFQTDKSVKKNSQDIEIADASKMSISLAQDKANKELAEKKEVAPIEHIKISVPELEGPKIISKIDLEQIHEDSTPLKKGRPKKKEVEAPALFDAIEVSVSEKPKSKKTKATVVSEEPVEKVIEEEKIVQQEEIVQQEQIIEEKSQPTPPPTPIAKEPEIEVASQKTNYSILTGPKIIGKVDLSTTNFKPPTSSPVESEFDKKKRKRFVVDKKPFTPNQRTGLEAPKPYLTDPDKNKFKKEGIVNKNRPIIPQQHNAPQRVIDPQTIQDKIKETQAKLSGGGGKFSKNFKSKYRKNRREEFATDDANADKNKYLEVTEFISLREFASLMNVDSTDVVSKCLNLGLMVSINHRLDAEVMELIAGEYSFEIKFIDAISEDFKQEDEDKEEDLLPRPPIVTIMGHVDHGKTSLLDFIRATNVVAGESGGITQKIGAYEVTTTTGKQVTFIDTPGHEAFTAMRARGTKITDVAVIVIAADDAVMPQTKEAIAHAQAANIKMIFAINKMDKEGANPEKIKEQLSQMNLLVEDWGGSYQCQEISAKKGLNVDLLLEKILLEAEMLTLKANPNRFAFGTVIDAALDKGRGYTTSILVQNGTLKVGDIITSGQYYGRIKAMFNERNQKVQTAPPSCPVLILGLNGAPQAGENFRVYEQEVDAKENATRRGQLAREQGLRTRKHITLDEIGRRLALGNFKELNVIIKADVDGSLEALTDALEKLSTEEVAVKIIHRGVGQITESDVMLAAASDAIIIAFQVRPSSQASKLAEQESIQIKQYSVIYHIIEEIRSAMEGMLQPAIEEKINATVEIRNIFTFEKSIIAGCYVTMGRILRNNKIRLIRDGIVIHTGELQSLKRFKDDAKEVPTNMECGITIKNYNAIKEGDIIEGFEQEEIKRNL